MSANLKKAIVTFTGTKSILFDRYAGSNEAKLEPIDKVYWDRDGFAVIPQINVFSALSAENTKSVAKMFFGKKAKPIGMAINNCLLIEQSEIPLLKDGERIHRDQFSEHFSILHHVARINKSGTAVPNPKERPALDPPWSMQFGCSFIPSGELTWDVMQQCFDYAGMIGLGTYRPLFGGFSVSVAVE